MKSVWQTKTGQLVCRWSDFEDMQNKPSWIQKTATCRAVIYLRWFLISPGTAHSAVRSGFNRS